MNKSIIIFISFSAFAGILYSVDYSKKDSSFKTVSLKAPRQVKNKIRSQKERVVVEKSKSDALKAIESRVRQEKILTSKTSADDDGKIKKISIEFVEDKSLMDDSNVQVDKGDEISILVQKNQFRIVDKKIFNGHTYILVEHSQGMNWGEAKAIEQKLDGYLVAISSKEENEFLRKFTRGNYWMGLSNMNDESEWRWKNGEDFSYSNWNKGEPNNSGGREHYGEFYSHGSWNDMRATANLKGCILEQD